MREIWAELDVAKIDESIRLSLFAQAAAAMTSQMADLLRVAPTRTQPGGLVDRLEPGVDRLTAGVDALLSESVRRQWDLPSQQLLDAGAPEALTAAGVRLFKTDGPSGIDDSNQRGGAHAHAVTHPFHHPGE